MTLEAPSMMIARGDRVLTLDAGSVFRFLRGFLLVVVCGAITIGSVAAATVRAYVQPANARPNQVVNFIISVRDGQISGVPNLRFPLQIGQASGVSTSRQIQIINGQQSSTYQLSWGIVATEPGEFVIPQQDVVVDGQVVKTNEVKLTVQQGGPGSAGPNAAADQDPNEPILQIEVGKKEVYQGEVVPVSCSLYVPRQTPLRRVGLIDIDKTDFAIARFPQQSEQTSTVIDGVGYYVLTFRSTLSSLRTGDLQVGPATMEILVDVPSEAPQRNIFPPGFPQGFFGTQSEPRKIVAKSQQVTLKVLPLPQEGRPAGFSGAVGDFSLSATASPTELAVGDPISVDVTVAGSGNFDALTPPALVAPDGWKQYPPKRFNIEGQLDQNEMPTLERKIGYTQVMVPEAVHQALPAFEISFFSPTKKAYEVVRTEPIPLAMKPAAPPSAASAGAGSGAESGVVPVPVPPPQADITDIVVNPPEKSRWVAPTGQLLLNSRKFWAVQALPVALLLLALVIAGVRRLRASRQAGLAGEVQQAWAALEDPNISDAEFLRRAAQMIHVASSGAPVDDPAFQAILERYHRTNFASASGGNLSGHERRAMLQALAPLKRRAISSVNVNTPAVAAIMFAGALLSGHAQETPKNPTDSAPDAVYQQAVQEIQKGNFTKAQYLAESLTKRNPPQLSPEVCELIGHARYRQDDLGRAALWYQRAELLGGRSVELRQNLRHLSERLRFLTFAPQSPLAQWSYLLSANQWTVLAAAGLWLVIIAVSIRILVGRRFTGWLIAVSILGLVVALPASAFAVVRPLGADRVENVAVVILPDVRAYTAATVTSGTVIDLPPGSQVRTLERRGSWTYVEIPEKPENLRGWVEAAALTPLWPWDAALVR